MKLTAMETSEITALGGVSGSINLSGGSVRPKPVPMPRRNQNLLGRESPFQNNLSMPEGSSSPSSLGVTSLSNIRDFNLNPALPPTLPPRNVSPSSSTSSSCSGGSSGFINSNIKPVPLPRKLVQQRLTPTPGSVSPIPPSKNILMTPKSSSTETSTSSSPSSNTRRELTESIGADDADDEEDTLDYENIPGKPSTVGNTDPKRGTINIFRLANQLEDPFDTDFEKSIREGEVQSAISFNSPLTFTSPLNDLDEATRKRLSTSSYKSSSTSATDDSSDHYMEPPPPRPVSSELAANLSMKKRESGSSSSGKRVSSLSSTYSRNSNCPLPTIPCADEGLEDFADFENVEIKKPPLTKVASCPAAPISQDDTMYEPISSHSSDAGSVTGLNIPCAGSLVNSQQKLPLDPLIPVNKYFSEAKRVTVPNVEKQFFSTSPSYAKGKKDLLNGRQPQARFDATAYDMSDLFPTKNKNQTASSHLAFGESDSLKRRSIASITESTDSFCSFDRNSVVLRRTASNRSTSTGSLTQAATRKIHEYDEVAIEDGTVIILNHSTNSSSSDSTNNNSNSSSSLTSRNSVIAEFDPLLTSSDPLVGVRSSSLKQREVSGSSSSTKSDASSSPVVSPLNLNDEEQHRYEFIDTDAEDETSNTSTVDNRKSDEEGSNSRNSDFKFNIPFGRYSSVENPDYFPADNAQRDKFQAHFDSSDDSKMNNEGPDEQYESIAPPIPSGLDATASPTIPPKPGRRFPPQTSSSPSPPSDESSTDEVKDATDGKINSDSSNVNNGEASSLVNQSSFFRRFSNKFRLIPIKEEKDMDKRESSPTTGSICKKCFSEHAENARCKFVPMFRSSIVYSSNLYKPGGIGRKDFVKKRVVLAKGKLAFYNEKSEIVSEIPLEKIAVISKKDDHRVNPNLPNLKYFELGFVHWKSSSLILAGSVDSERATWMQKYVESQSTNIPPSVTASFDRGGWCFMKETVTSDWRPGWLIVKDRTLCYAYQNSTAYYEMDLRKARSIVLSQKEEEHKCPFVDNQDVLTMDLICKILYVQTESGKITSGWEKQIRSAACFNGAKFHEMQLTLDSVPVIVDKCIDFLYAHGTLAEGIYRQSGSNTRISQLLSEFQKDAWAVQISHKEFSAHDVAGTLKRFFRTLPEPLVTSDLYGDWIKASSMVDAQGKQDEYIRLLESLPQINYNIMKKLICHLYAVHDLHEKNLMPLLNLAPIWGPTLMNVDTSKIAQSYETACAECEVVKDLIENYYTLFRVNPQEIAREKKMQDALENFHLGSCRRKHSGDMKIWIYLWQKDETSAINVTLTPQSTAHGIVHQICSKSQIRNAEHVSLHEVICQKSLERPLHPSEKVIETVLRWSIWDIDERKNNYLILRKNTLYPLLVHYAKEPRAVSGELKYADSKSKSFRKYSFNFSQAVLKYSKDVKSTSDLGSWNIEEITWYVGCEPKRTPPTKWCLTFVKRNYPFKRSKEEPFFGNVLCFVSEDELHKWLGAMVVGEHPEGLYPSVIV